MGQGVGQIVGGYGPTESLASYPKPRPHLHLHSHPRSQVGACRVQAAVCPEYGPVRAVQAWKNLKRQPVGKYRTQYVYRCPRVECRNQVVEPVVRRAADIIDWS